MIDFTQPSVEQSLHEANMRAEATVGILREALESLIMGVEGARAVLKTPRYQMDYNYRNETDRKIASHLDMLDSALVSARDALLRAGKGEAQDRESYTDDQDRESYTVPAPKPEGRQWQCAMCHAPEIDGITDHVSGCPYKPTEAKPPKPEVP